MDSRSSAASTFAVRCSNSDAYEARINSALVRCPRRTNADHWSSSPTVPSDEDTNTRPRIASGPNR